MSTWDKLKVEEQVWGDWLIRVEEVNSFNVKISRFKGTRPEGSLHIPLTVLDAVLAHRLRQLKLQQVEKMLLSDLIGS